MKRPAIASMTILLALVIVWLPIRAQQGATQAGAPQLNSAYTGPSPVSKRLDAFVPITGDMLRHPRPDNWLTYRNGYSRWGYSPLNQIDERSVKDLRMVWSRAMMDGPQQVEPIVYNGIMFLANAQDVVQALDATTGDLIWEYRRELPLNVGFTTGTVLRYRNLAIYDDKLFMATQDAFLVALDVRTGKVVWETKRGEYTDKLAATSGPVIADGKVITGSTCAYSSPIPGRLLHHCQRRKHWQRDMAPQYHSAAWTARR